MFCAQCGAPLPDTAQFCGNCGNQVSNRASAQIPNASPAAVAPSATPAVPSSPASASKAKLTASKLLLFASAACTVILLSFALVVFGSSIGMLCEELASYQKSEAMWLSLACGVSMGVFVIFLTCAASILVSKFAASKGRSPKGSPLAILFLALALVLCVIAIVSQVVFPNSAASGLGAACYVISAAFADMQPAAIILCVAAMVTAVLYARASKKEAR